MQYVVDTEYRTDRDGNIKDTPPDNTLDKHPSQTHVQISYHFLKKMLLLLQH